MNLKTRVRSMAMRVMASQRYLERKRVKARKRRASRRESPAVHYFHQPDDPFSHLTVQKLDVLRDAYSLPFHIHLVSGPAKEYQGDSKHFADWALRDALSISQDYGTHLEVTKTPTSDEVNVAFSALAPQCSSHSFAQEAFSIGEALWKGELVGDKSTDSGTKAVREGNELRKKLGHYLGGMFHFDGEWFWGIDRIRLLELRLIDEGFGGGDICVPQPTPMDTSSLNTDHMELEYFPSLRSPYTVVGHQRVLDLIERSGITVKLRPVMPMVMRGVPAPRFKQIYILTDAAREARYHDVPFGNIVDPLGDPVKRAFALFNGAMNLGRGMAFITAYLSSAWAEGIDITTDRGLIRVAARADIDWGELVKATKGTDWQTVLDENLNVMLTAGLWGVPSFRISGGNAETPFACWGQDRIWRVENEIARQV